MEGVEWNCAARYDSVARSDIPRRRDEAPRAASKSEKREVNSNDQEKYFIGEAPDC